MNIAIVFSGMSRSFKTTYPNFIKNIVNPLKEKGHYINIIMHVWDNKYNYVKYMKDEGTIDELISLYKPYHFLVEKYDLKTIERLRKDSNIDSYLDYIKSKNYHRKDLNHGDFIGGGPQRDNRISSFYSIEQTKNLIIEAEKKQNIKYDCIIKNRLDNQIFSPINLDIFSNLKDTVYSSMGYEGDDKHIDFTINDMFLVGDRNSMLKHLSLYSNLIDLLILRFNQNHPKPFQPVGLTKHNLVYEGVTNIKRFYLNHIVTRRLHKYKALNSVVTGDGWNIPVKKTDKIITECNRWI
jgi:hypothetical protein